MLKYIRVVLAVLSILALTFMFLDFTGLAARWLDWLPKMQLIPALLAVNFLAVAFLAVITYLFGRIYCSVICPLGIFQDFVIRVRSLCASKRKKKVGLFRYTPANSRLRYGFLIGFCLRWVLPESLPHRLRVSWTPIALTAAWWDSSLCPDGVREWKLWPIRQPREATI